MSRTGSCQCGGVTYSVEGDALLTYACHCTNCQKRTGSAFAMGSVFPLPALTLQGELSAWQRETDDGHINARYRCADCGNEIYGIGGASQDLIKLQTGTLDDTGDAAVDVHLWTRSAQPWVVLPEDALAWETQPAQMSDLMTAVLARRGATAD